MNKMKTREGKGWAQRPPACGQKRGDSNLFHAFIFKLKSLFIYLAALGLRSIMRDLYFSIWDLFPGVRLESPALGVQSLSPWTTREVPRNMLYCSDLPSAPSPKSIHSLVWHWICNMSLKKEPSPRHTHTLNTPAQGLHLVVQQLRSWASSAEGLGLILDWRTKIPHAINKLKMFLIKIKREEYCQRKRIKQTKNTCSIVFQENTILGEDPCPSAFIAALFTRAGTQKQPECLLTGE